MFVLLVDEDDEGDDDVVATVALVAVVSVAFTCASLPFEVDALLLLAFGLVSLFDAL